MYRIEVAPAAFKFLEKLAKTHRPIAERIKNKIDDLAFHPHSGKKLIGSLSQLRSLRVGDFRIIYSVIEQQVLVQIIKIGHRREIYR